MDKVFSVSQINVYIKNMFVKDYVLNNICIKGEVSNCKYHTSGHIYFTLKDESGQLACVMFQGQRSGLNFRLCEGQSVLVSGSINVYERDGKYQLYASMIRMDGRGVLYERFEQLKADLENEGLFDTAHKKHIPAYARSIGIVTAATGAAIRDICNIAYRRNPYIKLTLYPARVQGEGAGITIAKGIKALEKADVDTIIIGRGGGSIEDLWAFNEEIVARAIYECTIPIISAVGHETDFTIADYVADLRVPTPSAAAEMAVFDYYAYASALVDFHTDLLNSMQYKIRRMYDLLEQDKLKLRLNSPSYKLNQKKQELSDIQTIIEHHMQLAVQSKRHELQLLVEKLRRLSPLEKLSHGYSYTSDEDGKMISSISDVRKGSNINIAVTDGAFTAVVKDIFPVERSQK